MSGDILNTHRSTSRVGPRPEVSDSDADPAAVQVFLTKWWENELKLSADEALDRARRLPTGGRGLHMASE